MPQSHKEVLHTTSAFLDDTFDGYQSNEVMKYNQCQAIKGSHLQFRSTENVLTTDIAGFLSMWRH